MVFLIKKPVSKVTIYSLGTNNLHFPVNRGEPSGLATSRLVPVILEQFQEEDGSIKVADVLNKWVNKDHVK